MTEDRILQNGWEKGITKKDEGKGFYKNEGGKDFIKMTEEKVLQK